MNPTQQHSFVQEVDQHGRTVPPDFYDPEELDLIQRFSQVVMDLGQQEGEETVEMVELGANQAYYSCLFSAILRGRRKCRNIMVEPYEPFWGRAERHFEINGFDHGLFDHRSIGDRWVAWQGYGFVNGQVTVDELIQHYSIPHLHILHSDIDGAEMLMLDGAEQSLSEKRIGWIFLLTHGHPLHIQCRERLVQHGYKILYEEEQGKIGTDSLIIARA